MCVSVYACRMEGGLGDTNIHWSSRALVQGYFLKYRRVGLFQSTNVVWKGKRIFKGKPSLILFLHSQGQKKVVFLAWATGRILYKYTAIKSQAAGT